MSNAGKKQAPRKSKRKSDAEVRKYAREKKMMDRIPARRVSNNGPINLLSANDIDITIGYTPAELETFKPCLSNWLKTHAYIRGLQDNEHSLMTLRKLISIELKNGKRVQMITRLRSRYTAMRQRLEDQVLFNKMPELASVKG